MSVWSEASALCDLAIEAIDRRRLLRGRARQAAWSTPKKILGAIDALLSQAMDESERALAAKLEFEAIEQAFAGGGLWPMPAPAWKAGVATLGVSGAFAMAMGRAGASAKAMAGLDKHRDSHERRKDVGGKLLRIMQEGSLAWLEEDGRAGHVGPTGREVGDWALALHARWCESVGTLAEWDWERGIHAHGFGVWLDEMEAGGGGKFEDWGQSLLRASAKSLEQFGRLPRLPQRSGMSMPSWTLLENFAHHAGGGGVQAYSWAWGARFPMVGVKPWDESWSRENGWPVGPLADPLRGRAAVLAGFLSDAGLNDLLRDFERWQGQWAVKLEAQDIVQGLGQAGSAKPKARRGAL